jgi:hypothetical protein
LTASRRRQGGKELVFACASDRRRWRLVVKCKVDDAARVPFAPSDPRWTWLALEAKTDAVRFDDDIEKARRQGAGI